jgi:hypothetical protein
MVFQAGRLCPRWGDVSTDATNVAIKKQLAVRAEAVFQA